MEEKKHIVSAIFILKMMLVNTDILSHLADKTACNLNFQQVKFCSHRAKGVGIEFGLQEHWAVNWQIIGVHDRLSRSFVGSLEGRKREQANLLIHSGSGGRRLTLTCIYIATHLQRKSTDIGLSKERERTFLLCPAALCCS